MGFSKLMFLEIYTDICKRRARRLLSGGAVRGYTGVTDINTTDFAFCSYLILERLAWWVGVHLRPCLRIIFLSLNKKEGRR